MRHLKPIRAKVSSKPFPLLWHTIVSTIYLNHPRGDSFSFPLSIAGIARSHFMLIIAFGFAPRVYVDDLAIIIIIVCAVYSMHAT